MQQIMSTTAWWDLLLHRSLQNCKNLELHESFTHLGWRLVNRQQNDVLQYLSNLSDVTSLNSSRQHLYDAAVVVEGLAVGGLGSEEGI